MWHLIVMKWSLKFRRRGKLYPVDGPFNRFSIPKGLGSWASNYTLILFHGSVTFFFQLLRRSVDSYKPGRTIHSCQVELVWKMPAERLCYMLHIRGLRPAETSITITRDPSLPGQEKQLIVFFYC